MKEGNLMDQVEKAQEEFKHNAEVGDLMARLKELHNEICENHIDFDSEDFEEENEGYASSLKEDDIDEVSAFDYFYFGANH